MNYEKKTAWFHQARFGMFVHWGLYSLLERGEWVMYGERIPAREYAKLADQFNPKKFDPDSWASLAREAGMKYLVFTTRHHEGFCLYDSKVSDFTSVKTAARRDFVAEYVRACRKAGLRVGLYYSLVDWRFPGCIDGRKYPESFQAAVRQVHDQVRELMTNYGKIDYLFYDGGGWVPEGMDMAEAWRSVELNRMVRKLQPQIVINNRSGLDEDLDTPEQHVSASGEGRAWETCMTIGDKSTWGYTKYNPNLKSVTQLIQHLVTAASGAGNYLLNIGPKPDGSVRREEAARLKEIGKWMKVNSESIYGSERIPAVPGYLWLAGTVGGMVGVATLKGETLYLHLFRWPGNTACIPGIKSKVLSATVLATGRKVKVGQDRGGRLFFSGLPEDPPDPHDTVIALKLDGELQTFDYQGVPL